MIAAVLGPAKASCNICVDLNWDLYDHPFAVHDGRRRPLPYTQIQTTLQNVSISAERGCNICSLLYEGITRVSRCLVDKDESYSEMIAKSILTIEVRHNGPVMVRMCAHDDEDTTYLRVEFYAQGGALLHSAFIM
jgi:hypothetical protein